MSRLRTDRAADLGYVSEAVRRVCRHFGPRLAGHRFLRRALHAGQLHDRGWQLAQLCLREKDDVLAPLPHGTSFWASWSPWSAEYAAEQVQAGADVIQVFDSWVGCLSVDDYRHTCCRGRPTW